jgi:acetyl esterase/lipase
MEFFTSFLKSPKGIKMKAFGLGYMNAEWFIPENLTNNNAILYLHGGGYGMGSISSHRALASKIALGCGSKLLIIDYRLAPEHKFPAAVDDAYLAYTFLLEKGYPSENIIIMGDSAGGGLTLATMLKSKMEGTPLPGAAVCMSPWVDISASDTRMLEKAKEDVFIDFESIRIWGKKYAEGNMQNPLASPIYGDFTGFPPLLIQVGTAEILYYDSVNLAEKASDAGVDVTFEEYKDMLHVFQTFAGFLPQADLALNNIFKFISEKVNSPDKVNKQI